MKMKGGGNHGLKQCGQGGKTFTAFNFFNQGE